jgi:hypothetical protein
VLKEEGDHVSVHDDDDERRVLTTCVLAKRENSRSKNYKDRNALL